MFWYLSLSVKLPELLVYTNMEDDALTQLQQKLADFLKYVVNKLHYVERHLLIKSINAIVSFSVQTSK